MSFLCREDSYLIGRVGQRGGFLRMEDKERRLWPGSRLGELGVDSHEVGTWKKFPVGSSISSGGFTSDDLEE